MIAVMLMAMALEFVIVGREYRRALPCQPLP